MSELLSFLPLAILIGLVVIVVRAVMGPGRSGRPLICTTCGTQTRSPKSYTKGSILIEIVLWLTFIAPGLIYSLWRLTTRQRVCPACNSAALIPLDTPAGHNLVQQYGSRQA